MRFTIVRPTAFLETWIDVVGGGMARDGKALVFGRGENAVNFVSVKDVAPIVAGAADGNEVVDVGGPESFGFRELAQRLIEGCGCRRRVPISAEPRRKWNDPSLIELLRSSNQFDDRVWTPCAVWHALWR